jgi:hypothetical protein
MQLAMGDGQLVSKNRRVLRKHNHSDVEHFKVENLVGLSRSRPTTAKNVADARNVRLMQSQRKN